MLALRFPTFLRPFFKLAGINVLSNLLVPIAGLVDIAFLGHLAEIRYLAGVALASVLFNYLYWTFGFLRMSTTGMTAQAVGRNDESEVIRIGVRHGALALLLGVVILILQVPIRQLGFALLSATPEVKAAGQAFYNALIWGAPATLINFVIVGWLLGRSHSSAVLVLTAINGLANIVLDYWFVVRLGWASAGAGWATALSQYLMLGAGLLIVSRTVQLKHIKGNTAHLWDLPTLKMMLSLNRDIVIRTFVLISTFAVFTNLGSTFGSVTLTANTILLQVVTLAAYFIDGIAFATETFAGLLRGQGRNDQLRQLVGWAGAISVLVGCLFAIAFMSYPRFLFGRLTSHIPVLLYINDYVVWLLPVLGFGSIAYMLDGFFLGLTEGPILRRAMLQSVVVGFAPTAIIAWYWHSNHWLWLALSLFMLMRALTLGWKCLKYH